MPVAESYQPMLAVFRYGMVWGLVSVEDVISWADGVLADEERPDYFFIELSVAPRVDDQISAIDREWRPGADPLFARVLMGLLYHRLKNGQIETWKVRDILSEIQLMDVLRRGEDDYLCQLEFELQFGQINERDADEELLEFLAIYQSFNLQNAAEWPALNHAADGHFASLEIRSPEGNKRIGVPVYPVKKRVNGFAVVGAIIFTAAVFNVVFTYMDKGSGAAYIQFKSEAYVIGFAILFFGFCFLVVKGIYYLMGYLFGR